MKTKTKIKLRHRLAVFVMLIAGVECIQLSWQGDLAGGMIVAAIGFGLALVLDGMRVCFWKETDNA